MHVLIGHMVKGIGSYRFRIKEINSIFAFLNFDFYVVI